MNIALWILTILFVIFQTLTIVLYRAALHAPADDFGAGAIVWLCGLVAFVLALAWIATAVVAFFK